MRKTTSSGSKYGNTKITVDGVKFDSKLELFFYNYMNDMGLDFDFQVSIELIPKFKYNEQSIRPITARVDFILRHNGTTYYIDTKGFPTETAKIKYKMLRYVLHDKEIKTDVVWLKSQKESKEFINQITNQ
jgi:hypothetical protein